MASEQQGGACSGEGGVYRAPLGGGKGQGLWGSRDPSLLQFPAGLGAALDVSPGIAENWGAESWKGRDFY